MSKFCGECGTPWQAGDRFCATCGAAQPTPVDEATRLRPQPAVPAAPVAPPAPAAQPAYVPPAPAAAPAPAKAPVRRGPLVAVLAAFLVLVLGGVGFLVLTGDDDGGSSAGSSRTVKVARAALGFDNGLSILSEPGRTWTLSAADATEDGRGESLSSPYSIGDGQSFAPLVIGDVALVSVDYPTDDDDGAYDSTLTAVDATNGKVLWNRSGHDFANCIAVADTTQVVCTFREEGEDNEVKLLDVRTGEERAEFTGDTGDGWWLMLGVGGDSLYLARYESDSGRVGVTRVRTADLSEVWSKKYAAQGSADAEGAGVQVADGRVLVYVGVDEWVIDAASGRQIATDGSPERQLLTNGYAIRSDYDDNDSSTTIQDYAGFTIAQLPGYPWYGSGNGLEYVDHGTVGAGNSLFSLADNRAIWTRDDFSSDTSLTWTPDRRGLVAPNADYDAFEYLDPEDGSTRWSRSSMPGGIWTDDGYLTMTDGRVEVIDRRTGDDAWSSSYEFRTDEDYGEVVVADSAVIASTPGYLTGYTDFGSSPGSSGGGTEQASDEGPEYTTACGSEPVFTPTTAVDEGGGLTVVVTVHAQCPSGQWLHSAGQVISVTDGTVTYATGSFDFSGDPYWVPGSDDEPITLRLTFPYDNVSGSAAEVQDGINRQVIVVPCETDPDAYVGPVPESPEDGTDPSVPAYPSGPGTQTDQSEETALAALRRLAAADSPSVEQLAGKWVPQLASQKLGRPTDATYKSILAEHLRLRGRYPDVRLLWSGDWKSFSGKDFWVTVVGAKAAGTWRPPLQWCPAQGLDDGHCYAKNLNHTGPWQKATKHQANLYH